MTIPAEPSHEPTESLIVVLDFDATLWPTEQEDAEQWAQHPERIDVAALKQLDARVSELLHVCSDLRPPAMSHQKGPKFPGFSGSGAPASDSSVCSLFIITNASYRHIEATVTKYLPRTACLLDQWGWRDVVVSAADRFEGSSHMDFGSWKCGCYQEVVCHVMQTGRNAVNEDRASISILSIGDGEWERTAAFWTQARLPGVVKCVRSVKLLPSPTLEGILEQLKLVAARAQQWVLLPIPFLDLQMQLHAQGDASDSKAPFQLVCGLSRRSIIPPSNLVHVHFLHHQAEQLQQYLMFFVPTNTAIGHPAELEAAYGVIHLCHNDEVVHLVVLVSGILGVLEKELKRCRLSLGVDFMSHPYLLASHRRIRSEAAREVLSAATLDSYVQSFPRLLKSATDVMELRRTFPHLSTICVMRLYQTGRRFLEAVPVEHFLAAYDYAATQNSLHQPDSSLMADTLRTLCFLLIKRGIEGSVSGIQSADANKSSSGVNISRLDHDLDDDNCSSKLSTASGDNSEVVLEEELEPFSDEDLTLLSCRK